MPGDHALLSASAAHRWLNCPPSARKNEQYPETASEYAEKGTLAHAIAELKLRKYTTVISTRKYNAELKKLESSKLYDPSMASGTDMYLDYIKSIVTAMPKGYSSEVFTEQKVDYGHIAPGGFGTADCIILGAGDLHIIDYKNGSGVAVEAEDNPQLKLYALGAMREFEFLYFIERVHLSIVQPNNGGISTWETSPSKLLDWAEEIKPLAEAAHNGDGECQAGDWCRWCRALIGCPAQRKEFTMFEDLTKTSPEPGELSPAEIGDLLSRIPAVADWMQKLRDYAQAQIIDGNDIPGWKTVEGRSLRAWTDQEAAFKALAASGINEAILYERKPLTLAAIEKTVGKEAFSPANAYVTKPAGAPTLAPQSDKRPAFTGRSAEQVFENVEDQNVEENLL